jgi:uncharacterized protein (TIGR00299 family) protein
LSDVLWLNPAVGVAGDMLLAALLGVGAPEDRVRHQLERLGVEGWDLTVSSVHRRGLLATRAEVRCGEEHHHRPWSSIDRLLAGAGLAPRVEAGARAAFRRLGEVEAAIHGVPIDEVVFHEVGAVDALVDIVGVWAARDALGVARVVSAPVGLGSGTVGTAHGLLPAPAPATLALLAGHPTRPVDVDGETATPTGVALLVTLVDEWGPLPAGRPQAVGYGAGGRDPASYPNLVTAVVTRADRSARCDAVVVECNLDDATPEVLGHLVERALELGADDAWVGAVTMKKSRPGHQVRVLCAPALEAAVIELIASETGTLGLRSLPVIKHVLPRRTAFVDLHGHRIAIKVGPHGAKPEHADVVAAARSTGRPARIVAAEALARWLGDPPGFGRP